MAGQSSNLRASSSRRARKLVEIERDLDAAKVEEAKRQRHHFQFQPNLTAHPNAAAAVAPPLAAFPMAGNNAIAVAAFPMAGVNGAALRWSTAATLGAAAALPLPAIAGGANVPAAAAAAAAPFLLVAAAAPTPAAVGLPLAAALDKMKSDTLGGMLSALMPACDPPAARPRQSWAGPPPRWWPSAAAEWWAPDVAAHLHMIPVHTPVPYAPAYKLKKVQKVAALVAVVKHLSPDFDGIARKVRRSARLSVPEEMLWKGALANEAARHKAAGAPMAVPAVFNVILQQQQPLLLAPAATEAENTVDGSAAAAGGGEEDINLAGDASVAAPAGDGGQVVAAAGEPEQEEGQEGDDGGVVHGGAMAGDDGGEQPVDIPGDGNGGAAVAVDGGFDQLLDEMLAPYQVQQVQEVHQVVDAEAPVAEEAAEVVSEAPGAKEAAEVASEAPGAEEVAEAAPEGRPWYVEGGMSSIFDDFDLPLGAPHKNYY